MHSGLTVQPPRQLTRPAHECVDGCLACSAGAFGALRCPSLPFVAIPHPFSLHPPFLVQVWIVHRFDYLEVRPGCAGRPRSPWYGRRSGARRLSAAVLARELSAGQAATRRARPSAVPLRPPLPHCHELFLRCFQSSKVMARRAAAHPKIEFLWEHEATEAYGGDDGALSEWRVGGVR